MTAPACGLWLRIAVMTVAAAVFAVIAWLEYGPHTVWLVVAAVLWGYNAHWWLGE